MSKHFNNHKICQFNGSTTKTRIAKFKLEFNPCKKKKKKVQHKLAYNQTQWGRVIEKNKPFVVFMAFEISFTMSKIQREQHSQKKNLKVFFIYF